MDYRARYEPAMIPEMYPNYSGTKERDMSPMINHVIGQQSQGTARTSTYPFLQLPAEIRVKIYRFFLQDLYVDLSDRRGFQQAAADNQVVLSLMLTCKTVCHEVPPIVSDVVAVALRSYSMLCRACHYNEAPPWALLWVPPIFSRPKHITVPLEFEPRRPWGLHGHDGNYDLLQTKLIDVVREKAFGWKSVRLVLQCIIQDAGFGLTKPVSRELARRRVETAVQAELDDFSSVMECMTHVPGVDLIIDVNIRSKRLCSLVGKAHVTYKGIDLKMWRMTSPEVSEVEEILHNSFGLE